MSACPLTAELLEHLGKEVANDNCDTIEDHLEICASCRNRLEALAKAVTCAGVQLLRSRAPVGTCSQVWLERLGESPPSLLACASAEGEALAVPRTVQRAGILTDLPGFTDLREVGRGGMGVVYRAQDRELDRPVALKIVSEGRTAGAAARERFRRESLALARLKHPNVVRIYGVGEYEGLPYLVMEWVEGGDLAERLRRGVFQPREVAALGLPLAQALEAAHDQGIIHRDLKPSNILLADAPSGSSQAAWPCRGMRLEPKIGDFGLAKLVEYDAKATQSGAAIGTPDYMAPEQTGLIENAQHGPATDIYGLGAILYEMLVGHPPFAGATRHETIRLVVQSEVVSPRRLRSSIPRDLETICLKCLERDPCRRYASAGSLAADLALFLDGRPIRSRRVRAAERGARWCRRNPLVAGLLAALALVFLVGFATVTLEWRRADAEANRANRTARAAAEARDAESRLRIQAQTEMATRDFDRGLELARHGDADSGQLWMAESLREMPDEARKFARMARTNLAAWSGQAASLRTVLEHRGLIYQAIFRSDGRVVLTGSADGTAQLWETFTGRPLGRPMRHGDQVLCLAFSPDGRLVLTAGSDGKARLWNASSGEKIEPAALHGDNIWSVAFSPDGRLFMTYGQDRMARFWDTKSGRSLCRPFGSRGMINPQFSPEGRWVVCGNSAGVAQAPGSCLGKPGSDRASSWGRGVDRRLFAPRSPNCHRRLRRYRTALGCRIWPAHWTTTTARWKHPFDGFFTRRQVGADGKHRPVGPAVGRHIRRAARAGDAPPRRDSKSRLLTGWPVDPDGKPGPHGAAVGRGHRSSCRLAPQASTPDHIRVVLARRTARADSRGGWRRQAVGVEAQARSTRRACRADHHTPRAAARVRWAGDHSSARRFSAQTVRVCSWATRRTELRAMVDTRTNQPVALPMKHRWPCVIAVAFSPDGRRIATASCERGFQEGGGTSATCQIWDAGTSRPLTQLLPHINWPSALAFRPDGRVLATGDYSGAVHLWDVETGASLGPMLSAPSIVFSLAFSPDGKTLAVGTAERVHQVELWDLAAGKPAVSRSASSTS